MKSKGATFTNGELVDCAQLVQCFSWPSIDDLYSGCSLVNIGGC